MSFNIFRITGKLNDRHKNYSLKWLISQNKITRLFFFHIQIWFASSNNLDQQSKFERFTLTIAEIQIQTLEKIQNDIRAATVPRETILENRSRRRLRRIRGMKLYSSSSSSSSSHWIEHSLKFPYFPILISTNFSLLPVSRSSLFRSLLDFRSRLRRQNIHLYFSSLFLHFSIVHQNTIFLVIVPPNPDVWHTWLDGEPPKHREVKRKANSEQISWDQR